MDTVVQSRSKTVVIGPEQPFCVIGERINPTGRKAFQAQLQAGDLSQLETDVAQQVDGGADMLDVNVGDPLADEVGLMAQAVPLVQGLTEQPPAPKLGKEPFVLLLTGHPVAAQEAKAAATRHIGPVAG